MTLPQTGDIPAWSLGDRLRKAREHAHLTQLELAGEVGISRASVVNYETGRSDPSRPVLLSWALRCGVDYEWLAGCPHPGLASVSDKPIVRTPGRCTPRQALYAVAA
jgi:transcriptional regulator with XRE-family HTH domain